MRYCDEPGERALLTISLLCHCLRCLRNFESHLLSALLRAESERMRMEAEARDSSEQLREMAEKVFQLLERLKLAELGKSKAVEALRTKESELTALKKKNSRCVSAVGLILLMHVL